MSARDALSTPSRRLWAGRLHAICRLLIGLTLSLTALGKALDVAGFERVLQTYHIFPSWSLWLLAGGMPVIEAFIAFAMLSGRQLRRGIAASLLLHGGFAVLLTVELIRGIHLRNCGCFGVFWARPLTWSTPLEDVVLLAITLGVLLTSPERSASAEMKRSAGAQIGRSARSRRPTTR